MTQSIDYPKDLLTVPVFANGVRRFLRNFRQSWRLVAGLVVGLFAFCQLYFAMTPDEFQSRTVVLPYTSDSRNLGSLGGLGAIAGGAILAYSQRAVPPEAYADLLRLPSVRDRLALSEVSDGQSSGPAWRIMASALGEKPETSSLESMAGKVLQRVAVSFERKNGFVIVTARAPRAGLAASLASAGAAVLAAELVKIDQAKAEQQARFTSGQLQRARRELDSLQAEAIRFLESNRVLTAPAVVTRKRWIDERVSASERIYWDLAGQYAAALMRQAEEAPVFTVVDTARVPTGPSWPRKGPIRAAAVLLALLASAGVVLLRMFLPGQQDNASLTVAVKCAE